jgi:hypothetical protein
MTRFAGVPEQLRAAATVLGATAPELDLAAVALSSIALPAMPPGVALVVEDTLWRASATLRQAALEAKREGEDLKRRGLWLELADAGGTAWAYSVVTRAALDIPTGLMDFVERKRAIRLLQVWRAYKRLVVPTADRFGPESYEALWKYFRFQYHYPEVASRLPMLAEGAGDMSFYERASGVPLPLLRGVTGKILGPLGVATGFLQIVNPEHSHGWERTGDEVAGGANLIGSATATLMTFGSAATVEAIGVWIPGVNVAVAVLILGSAAWELYTHRREVARALVAGGKDVRDHPLLLIGPAGPAAQLAWDHRRTIARGAVATAQFGANSAENAAHLAVSAAGASLNRIESVNSATARTVSRAEGAVGHEAKKLFGKLGSGLHL